MAEKIVIFTDGASSGNPGAGGWGAVILAPDPESNGLRVDELGGGQAMATNNQMELMAVLKALQFVAPWQTVPVQLNTDSTYVIRGMTEWVERWKKSGWLTASGSPVANQGLWQEVDQCCGKRPMTWNYVPAHQGVPGNERADQIAVAFSQRRWIDLYKGKQSAYDLDLRTLAPSAVSRKALETSPKKQSKPYAYLSLVGNVPMQHSNWPDCEKRVKGVSGAKFQKVMNPEEAQKLLKTWGFESI